MGPKGAPRPTLPRNAYLGSIAGLEMMIRTRHCPLPHKVNSEKPVNPAIIKANSAEARPPLSTGVKLGAFCENHRREVAEVWFQPGLPGPRLSHLPRAGEGNESGVFLPTWKPMGNPIKPLRIPFFSSTNFCKNQFCYQIHSILCVL